MIVLLSPDPLTQLRAACSDWKGGGCTPPGPPPDRFCHANRTEGNQSKLTLRPRQFEECIQTPGA